MDTIAVTMYYIGPLPTAGKITGDENQIAFVNSTL